MNPIEYGYIKSPVDDEKPTQVKIFKSRREARRFLRLMEKNLNVGWVNTILAGYIRTGGKQ